MSNQFRWLDGMSVFDNRQIVRANFCPSPTVDATPVSPFMGVPIKVSQHMPDDQVVMLPTGEAVMGHAKYAELLRDIQGRVDDLTSAALTGNTSTNTVKVEPKPDPEKEAMQNNELWGAF